MKKLLAGKGKIDPDPIKRSISVIDLIDKTFLAYNAGRLREASQIFLQKMLKQDVLVGMSITGALTPAGLGISCLIPLIKNGLVDWIVSTGANLYHDMHFSLGKSLYVGSPYCDDTELKKQGIIRIYDILFEYDVLLSTDRFIRTVMSAAEFQREMGSAELHYLLGKYCAEREKKLGVKDRSLLSVAYAHKVPVYTSSPGDSSIGMNIAALDLGNSKLKIDTSLDVNETAALVYNAKKHDGKSAVILLGGGSPKNFVLQTEPHIQEILGLKEVGHDYFIQITDARPDTGGLSGATPSEAVSWGKVNPGSLPDSVVVYTDTTIALPLMTAYVIAHGKKRAHKRLYDKRADLLSALKRDWKKAGK
ncbi:MAG: deoxyhypusine synthase [Proteobacteria bacterium]|nr:deoxyhypusine synthase [Pseudomonadota bacterium]